MHGEHVQRGFADTVHRARADAPPTRPEPGRHVHHDAALAQVRQQRCDRLGGPDHVHRDVLLQVLVVELERRLAPHGVDAGVVEQEVEARVGAERRGHLFPERRDRRGRRRVAFEDVDPVAAARPRREGAQVAEIAVQRAHSRDDGVGGVGGELADELEAQAAVRAGEAVGFARGHSLWDGETGSWVGGLLVF